MSDRVLGMRQIVWPSHRGDCGRLSTQHSATRRNSPGETNKEKGIHRRHPEQRLHFSPPEVSQAAACDGRVYSVDYNGQNSGTQAHALPLFED